MRAGPADETEADNVILHISQKDTKQCSTILGKHKASSNPCPTHTSLSPDANNTFTRIPLPLDSTRFYHIR